MKKKTITNSCWAWCRSGNGFAIFLIVLGAFYLARDLNFLPDISFWPIIFIAFGIYLLAKKGRC